jgi:TolB protein
MSRAEPVTSGNQEIEAFDISEDGRWLVFDSDRTGTQQLYRMPLQGGEVEQLTNDRVPAMAPAVSPNGREIAYHTFRGGTRQLFVLPSEGGTPLQLTHDSAQNRGASWLPDGQSITFVKDAFLSSQESRIVSRDSSGSWGSPRTLLKGGETPVPSPDGKRAVTVSTDKHLMMVPLPTGQAVRIATTGVSPVSNFLWGWSPDGRFIYYVGEDSVASTAGIWRVPAGGGASRLVLRFDDPAQRKVRPWFKVHGNRIYFTRGDPQSDVWMTEVVGER